MSLCEKPMLVRHDMEGLMRDSCCCAADAQGGAGARTRCPACKGTGKKVPVITLKSLLVPEALSRLDPQADHHMCTNRECDVVYFNHHGSLYKISELKVPVFQKSDDGDCPVCYCFGWTRNRIRREIEETGKSSAISVISEHVKAGRCGCEANNPQGSCCLGNVRKVVSKYLKDKPENLTPGCG